MFLSLTDSEEGWVWVLSWTAEPEPEGGFRVVGRVNLNDGAGEGERDVGASVAVWVD